MKIKYSHRQLWNLMAKTFPFSYKLETTIIIISNKTLTKKLEKNKKMKKRWGESTFSSWSAFESSCKSQSSCFRKNNNYIKKKENFELWPLQKEGNSRRLRRWRFGRRKLTWREPNELFWAKWKGKGRNGRRSWELARDSTRLTSPSPILYFHGFPAFDFDFCGSPRFVYTLCRHCYASYVFEVL